MVFADEKLVQKLLKDNVEFKKAYDEHHDYGKKASKLEKRPVLTVPEEEELKRLKKLKLAAKDKMEEIMAASS